jgi:hypothetical protein
LANRFLTPLKYINVLAAIDVWTGDPEEGKRPLSEVDDRPDFHEYADSALKRLSEARAAFARLGLKFTDMKAAELEDQLKAKTISRNQIPAGFREIEGRLRDELLSVSFWLLESKFKEFLVTPADMTDLPLPFGTEIGKLYPSAAYEIDETAKCLAFERSTAAVFHLMRVLEIGIKAVSKCLAISDPAKEAERNWGVMLRKIKDEIDRRNKVSSPTVLCGIAQNSLAPKPRRIFSLCS